MITLKCLLKTFFLGDSKTKLGTFKFHNRGTLSLFFVPKQNKNVLTKSNLQYLHKKAMFNTIRFVFERILELFSDKQILSNKTKTKPTILNKQKNCL